MRKLLVVGLIGMALALSMLPARADFFVVVNRDSPVLALTQREAVALFMGRNRALSNGKLAVIFDLPQDSADRHAFYQLLTGMDPAQVNSYWSRLIFSGRSLPPQPLADEAAMTSMLVHNPNAVGWLTREPADRQLRTVFVLKDGTAAK